MKICQHAKIICSWNLLFVRLFLKTFFILLFDLLNWNEISVDILLRSTVAPMRIKIPCDRAVVVLAVLLNSALFHGRCPGTISAMFHLAAPDVSASKLPLFGNAVVCWSNSVFLSSRRNVRNKRPTLFSSRLRKLGSSILLLNSTHIATQC